MLVRIANREDPDHMIESYQDYSWIQDFEAQNAELASLIGF